MANVKAFKKMGIFSGNAEWVRLVYDFAKDGGAVGALDLAEAGEDMVLMDAMTKVKAACTSGGAATLIVGRTGDTDAILASTAVAALTLGSVHAGDAASRQKKMVSGDKLLMTIGTAAFTAGQLEIWVLVSKF